MSENIEEDKIISEYSQEKPKVNKVLFIVLVLLLLGGSVFALRSFIFRPSPERILSNMVTKMSELDSYGFEWKGNIGVVGEDSSVAFAYNMTGESDMVADVSKLDFDFNASIEGTSFTLTGDAIGSGNDAYFRLTTIPVIPFMDLSMIRNQWIKVEVSTDDVEEIDRKVKIATEKIMKLIKDNDMMKVKEALPDTKINGTDVYHLVVYLDKDVIKNITPDLVEIIVSLSDDDYLIDMPTESDYQEFNRLMDQFGNIEMEVFIGKKDFYLYRLDFTRDMDLSEINNDMLGTLSMDAQINFYDFGKSVVVEIPDDYITIEELMAPMMMDQDFILPEEEIMMQGLDSI